MPLLLDGADVAVHEAALQRFVRANQARQCFPYIVIDDVGRIERRASHSCGQKNQQRFVPGKETFVNLDVLVGKRTRIDRRLTLPRPRFAIWVPKTCEQRNIPVTFTSSILRHISSG